MPNVLYVGDNYYPVALQAEFANHDNHSAKWTIHQVPLGSFPRATAAGLRSWLKGEVVGYRPLRKYAAVIIACDWIDMVPIVRESLPKTPIIRLGCKDEDEAPPDGIDAVLDHIQITELMPTIDRLLNRN